MKNTFIGYLKSIKRRCKSRGLEGIIVVLLSSSLNLSAQALRGTTGLLHAPTADMQTDKTIMLGGNLLDVTPLRYYDFDVRYTFNYYLNVTFFPWLEIGYTCTVNYANEGSSYFPKEVWGKYSNQDRSFYFRLRAWKEGWWKSWTPQIVLGADDPGTHDYYGGGGISRRDQNGGNCFFSRYYVAVTKHFTFEGIGQLGAHLAYVLDKPATWEHHNRPSLGFNFRMGLSDKEQGLIKAINGFNWMAEYDARTMNIGAGYTFWHDHINLIAELNDGRYFSGGVQFKVHLK
jgi:hypothetical protein